MDVLAGGAGGRAETLGRRCGGAGGERLLAGPRRCLYQQSVLRVTAQLIRLCVRLGSSRVPSRPPGICAPV